jgi:hypothetical protein
MKESIAELNETVSGKPEGHPSFPRTAAKQPSKPNAVGIAVILVVAVSLSAFSNFLFFKELLIACSIIGMAILFGALGKPRNGTAQSDGFDPSSN